jgi:aminoacyl-tRNA hydrolase
MYIRFPSRIANGLAWRQKHWRERINVFLASLRRRSLTKTVFVGITGSVGKTTAKDLTVAVLAQGGSAKGNSLGLNYLNDMAKVVLELPRDLCFAVLEVATSGPGTIDPRIRLCRPQIAAMTVIGRDHIKKFGSMEAIAEEKAKLIKALPEHGTAVLNRDDPLIRAVSERTRANRLWFGTARDADLRLLQARSHYPEPLILELSYKGRDYTCRTGLYGTHLAVPALAAIGIGLAAGLSVEQAIAGLAHAQTTPGRMQVVLGTDGVTFLRDDFKAPHWTLQTTLDFLKNAQAQRKVAVIGTFSDYSLSASKLYPKVARRVREVADLVIFIGPHALRALKARTDEHDHGLQGFTQIREAHAYLTQALQKGDLVLLKGTNRVDHLVRLYLARERPVNCWVADCGKNRFCDRCELIAREDSSEEQALSYSRSEESTTGATGLRTVLVVGLGNPDEGYANTPHNIGAETLDLLAKRFKKSWAKIKQGEITELEVDGCDVILFKPGVMMNNSGRVVKDFQLEMGIDNRKIIVVHDDIDLPLSDVRLKYRGSDGGHKGLRSVFDALGNVGFMTRVRIGVRLEETDTKSSRDVVLKPFASHESELVQKALDKAIEMIKKAIHGLNLSVDSETT